MTLGYLVRPGRGVLGILIDQRGRFSLTQFQLVAWTIVVLSLISGIFWGRLIDGVDDALSFTIPDEVLGLLGIAAGSTVAATVAKTAKDATAAPRIPVTDDDHPPRPAQVFLLEEGEYADQLVDVTKFQNFVITLVLVVAYIALAVQKIDHAHTASAMNALPTFSSTFLTLLGISHAAYVSGKLPNRTGQPAGPTVADRTPSGVQPRGARSSR